MPCLLGLQKMPGSTITPQVSNSQYLQVTYQYLEIHANFIPGGSFVGSGGPSIVCVHPE